MRLHQALILILVAAALATAGCTGNSPELAATATPGPTTSPGPGASMSPGATAEPSAGPADMATHAAELFDFSKINWLEYAVRSANETGQSSLRYEISTATFNGAPAKMEKIIIRAPNDTVIAAESYYDPASGREIGGHVKFVIGGQTFIDSDAIPDNDQKSNSIVWQFQQGNWPLHSSGMEIVTINGKTYTCTKYAVGDAGEHGTAWMAPGIPLPVRIDSVTEKGEATMELTGWG